MNFTLAANTVINEDGDDAEMDGVVDDIDDDMSSSDTPSVSAIDEDDLKMLNQALIHD